MRKHYLDNIRSFVILLVVLFHVFFYYNNIGISPIFPGLEEYKAGAPLRFDSLFQYLVYPWFMVLLFVVAGMSAFYALQNKEPKPFLKARATKLLVPSILGILCFGWISGYVIINQSAEPNLASLPGVVKYIMFTSAGIGAMWFCHVLFLASAVLLLIRKLDIAINKSEKLVVKSKTASIIIIPLLYFLFWGTSKILNTPLISAYRFGIYFFAFFAGYYLFSQEQTMEIVKKLRFVTSLLAIASGIYFVYRSYGTYYGEVSLLSTWYANLFVYFAVLAVLGIFATYFNKTNSFTAFCSKNSFAIYIIHISVMVWLAKLLSFTGLNIWLKYIILAFGTISISLLLGIVIKRIPVLRYLVLGIKANKSKEQK